MFSLVGVFLDLFLLRRLTVTVEHGERGVLAGETLRGTVDLTLEKVVASAGLRLVVSGYEQMQWAETDSDGDTTNYSSKIEHLHLETDITGISAFHCASPIPTTQQQQQQQQQHRDYAIGAITAT